MDQKNCFRIGVAALFGFVFLGVSLMEAAAAGMPPTANRVLWLKADSGVATNADGTVKSWADQSGGVQPHDGSAVGAPKLTASEFATGPKPIVSFNGLTDGIVLTNVSGLELTNLTVYLVACESTSSMSRVFVSVFDASVPGPLSVTGWALGVSDVTQDGVKWFTCCSPDSLESAGYTLTPNVPSLITVSYDGADGYKSMFLGSNFVSSEIGVAPPAYTPNCTANLGQLTAAGGQRLAGGIAEILIYSTVSDSQNVEVWRYLNAKYFNSASSGLTTNAAPAVQTSSVGAGAGASPALDAQTKAHRWVAAKFGRTATAEAEESNIAHWGEDSATPPFSFIYAGKSSEQFLTNWKFAKSTHALDDQRTEHTLRFTDPKTKLEVRCVGVEYQDFPTIEWTVYLKNTGSEDTPILEQLQPLDLNLQRALTGEYTLHLDVGNRMVATTLKSKMARQFSVGSEGVSPYLNFELPGEGLIAALSWPGDMTAAFARDEGNGLRIRAGQANTRFKLHPGEEIRTPMVVLQFYNGDFTDAQNIWRRWMIAHNMPRPGGKLLAPQLSASSAYQYDEMVNANETNQQMFIDRYVAGGVKPDFWWMDAGWYPPNISTNGGEAWGITGTWTVDEKRFPHGLHGITDYARARGIKSIVWFQPERVSPGTWLYEKHPDWLIGPAGGEKLLDFGNPKALQWAIDYFSQFLKDQRIDIFRMDTNVRFSPFWRKNDAPDRQGITEIHHVEGYLAFLDGLLRRNPKLRIDHWRTDLETLRRSAPLILDLAYDPVDEQCANYRRSFWLPWHGLCSLKLDTYDFRSMMCLAVVTGWDQRDEHLNNELGHRLIQEWRGVAPNYFGDYYPLTPYSLENDTWMAWQFNRPESGEGVVQIFRRKISNQKSESFKLRGLNPKARYTVQDIDEKSSRVVSGRELMEQGIAVTLEKESQAAIITYHEIAPAP